MSDGFFRDLASILTVALLVELVFVTAFGAYVFAVWWRSPRESKLLRAIVFDDLAKVAAGGWIAALLITFYGASEPLPAWTRPITVVAAMVLFGPVIHHGITIFMLRWGNRHGIVDDD